MKTRPHPALIVLAAILGFFFMVGFIGSFFQDNQSQVESALAVDDTRAQKFDPVKDSIEKAALAADEKMRVDSLQRLVKRMTPKFIAKKDEFKELTFYSHRTQGSFWPNRKTIYAECNSDGYYYLRSNYYSDDWLFHVAISVKFADGTILKSEVVETFDPQNRQENDAGSIWENVTYGPLGQAIIARIAENPNQRIVVRFHGRKYYDEVTLGPNDRKSIKETYDLARTLGELKYHRSRI